MHARITWENGVVAAACMWRTLGIAGLYLETPDLPNGGCGCNSVQARARTRTHTHTARDDLGPIGSIGAASNRCVKAHCEAIARPRPKTSYCLLLSKTGVQISVGLFHGHRKRFNNNMSSILLSRKFNFQFNFTLISACIKVNHLEEMERCISPLRARTCAGSPQTRGRRTLPRDSYQKQ